MNFAMPEYHVIRVLLGLGLLYFLSFDVLSSSLRYYCYFVASCQLIPQFIDSYIWMRNVWLPLDIVQTVLGVYVCRSLFFLFTKSKTYWEERISVFLAAICVGLAAILLLSALQTAYKNSVPHDAFETALLYRQYFRLGVLVTWFVLSYWFGIWKTIRNSDKELTIAFFWCVWLTCQFIMSTTCEPCLSWKVINWQGGRWWSRLVGDSMQVVQIFAIIWCTLRLKKGDTWNEQLTQ